jgi:hypothetical protein
MCFDTRSELTPGDHALTRGWKVFCEGARDKRLYSPIMPSRDGLRLKHEVGVWEKAELVDDESGWYFFLRKGDAEKYNLFYIDNSVSRGKVVREIEVKGILAKGTQHGKVIYTCKWMKIKLEEGEK